MRLLCLLFLCLTGWGVNAAPLRIAVASNFYPTLQTLVAEYPFPVVLSHASSGKLYAQIKQGAPFELFLSADMQKPRKLVELGLAEPSSLAIYARGQLALFAPGIERLTSLQQVFTAQQSPTIAIANPRFAPYGVAAQSFLFKHASKKSDMYKLVMAENVSQALLYVASGNADAGLVAYSQLIDKTDIPSSQFMLLPETDYPAIEQGIVILKNENTEKGKQFYRFIFSAATQSRLTKLGYLIPESSP